MYEFEGSIKTSMTLNALIVWKNMFITIFLHQCFLFQGQATYVFYLQNFLSFNYLKTNAGHLVNASFPTKFVSQLKVYFKN